MTHEKKSPRRGDEGLKQNNRDKSNYSRCPTFPANGSHVTHCRAVLAYLLTGAKVDQFTYYERTGYPLVDFRTRISDLYQIHNWPIEREFHHTLDFNGEPRRVMWYWLNQKAMKVLYERNPKFKQRCLLLRDTFERGEL